MENLSNPSPLKDISNDNQRTMLYISASLFHLHTNLFAIAYPLYAAINLLPQPPPTTRCVRHMQGHSRFSWVKVIDVPANRGHGKSS